MNSPHDSGMSDADHLALAVENWANDLSGQLQTMLENRDHAYGHVEVFENVLKRLSDSLETLGAEMHKFRTETQD